MLRELISLAQSEQLSRLPNHAFIPLDQIRVSNTHQLDRKKIQRIKQHLEQNGGCLPIEVRPSDDHCFCIAGDGRHRFTAHHELGISFILCRIRVQ